MNLIDLIKQLQCSLYIHERMGNGGAYFSVAPKRKSKRFVIDRLNSLKIEFSWGDFDYSVENKTVCQGHDVYYHYLVYENGIKKDSRAVKRVLEEIEMSLIQAA